MKLSDVYLVSLCKNGILGGLLYVKETELVYCTNKLTVPEKIRRLHIPYQDISSVKKASFHTISIARKNGEHFRFLVFARESLMNRVLNFL